jgi:zinc transport system permease protein
MAIIAAVIGSLSAFGGLEAAYIFDTPAGPTIVCIAAISFIIFNLTSYIYKKINRISL